MKHLNIKIFGKVQDVNFRRDAKILAAELDISGFVRNEPYGTLYLEAEGDENALQKFLGWCKDGPRHAHVHKIETSESPLRNLQDFKIMF